MAAIASSTSASSADVSIASKPLAAAIAAGVAAAGGDQLGEHLLGLRRRELHRRPRAVVSAARSAAGTAGAGPCSANASLTWTSARAGVAAGRGDGEHVVVLAALDDDGDRLAVDRRRRWPRPGAARRAAGSSGSVGADPLDPLGVGVERHEVGLEEVPVVVGVLLGAQRVRAAVALVPVAGLLAHRLAGLEQVDLAPGLVLDGPARASAPS